ncbi:hypothetical protein IKM56_01475 [Candidatus Saccharibacteria bacterium]|nr:hypothetical protein [Candidatus Saccharibacteria bacterium]
MQRIVIVYNPRSSHAKEVEEKVIEPARHLGGYVLAKFEVADAIVDINADRLAKILFDNDLVVVAGGDGTATVAINGIMLSKAKNVRLGVQGFGNFNDLARSLGNMSFDEIIEAKTHEVWPLECVVNGKHWRYGMCYFTIGMFAEACAVFDDPKTRKTLRKGGRKLIFSLFTLAKWWLKQHKRSFLPSFLLGDASGDFVDKTGASDYMAVNSLTVAKIMKGDRFFTKKKEFLSATGELTRFWPMVSFMLKSIFKRIPGDTSELDVLRFGTPSRVTVQAEGEYAELEDVKKIEIAKSDKPLLVVTRTK